jgi:hypothetical protein
MTLMDSDGKGPRKLGLTAQYPGRQREKIFLIKQTTKKIPTVPKTKEIFISHCKQKIFTKSTR